MLVVLIIVSVGQDVKVDGQGDVVGCVHNILQDGANQHSGVGGSAYAGDIVGVNPQSTV